MQVLKSASVKPFPNQDDRALLVVSDSDVTLNYVHSSLADENILIDNVISSEEAVQSTKNQYYDLILIESSLFTFEMTDTIQQNSESREVKFLLILKNEELNFYLEKTKYLDQFDFILAPINLKLLELKLRTYFLPSADNTKIEKLHFRINQLKNQLTNKSISHTKSIEYAKLIQERILPEISWVENNYEETFILYEPKELIGGDFYMLLEINSRFIIVSADCTGHGVPGAMLSMIGYEFIRSIIVENRIFEPGLILTKLNQKIRSFFGKNSAVSTHGMDVSLISYRMDTKMLEYASSKRPILIIENSTIVELRGDSFSIGDELAENYAFQSFDYPISGPMWIYQFTDGVTDQFGGKRNKKFGRKALKELLQSTTGLDAKRQKILIQESLIDYQGVNKQTDDLTLVGKYFPLN
jgi:serine phosphatase RsbU (regulator of sigma subunit)